jgi:hypothetical protein
MLDTSLKDTRRMLRALEKKSNISAMVRAEQLRTIKRAMLAEQAKIFRKLGDIVSARRVEAASRAVALGTATDAALFAAIGDTAKALALGEALSQGLAHSVEVAVTRMAQSAIPLSERIYRTQAWMDGRVEAGINSALARGLSAQEFAKEAEDWFNPNTPGGVRYAALRLARSEINNAFHAISVNSAMDKPWVHGMQWHLSRSHPKTDVCDQYANEDHSRLGAGVYKTEDVPRKPHPHCFCYVTPVVESEEAFIDNMFAGKYDAQISKLFAESAGQELGRNIPTLAKSAKKAVAKRATTPAVRRSAVPKPSTAVPKSNRQIPVPKRTPGRDLSSDMQSELARLSKAAQGHAELSDAAMDIWEKFSYTKTKAGRAWFGDQTLSNIIQKQGFGLPGTVTKSSLDILVQERNWRLVHRGFTGGEGVTGREALREFISQDEYFTGLGIYGNGIYTSIDSRVAEYYAKKVATHPGTSVSVRIAISPDARIIEYSKLQDMQQQAVEDLRASFGLGPRASHWDQPAHIRDAFRVSLEVINDPGRFAALRGYDVIQVLKSDDGAVVGGKRTSIDQYVILNRSVIVVEA